MNRLAISLGLALVIHAAVLAADPTSPPLTPSDTVILWGPTYSFTLSAYDGWKINSIDHPYGKIAEIHNSFSKPETAHLYVSVDAKPVDRDVSLEDGIATTVAVYVEANPGLKADREDPLITASGKSVPVVTFRGHPSGRVESVAFIDESSLVIRIGYAANSQAEFATNAGQFKRVVGSYRYLGLKIEQK